MVTIAEVEKGSIAYRHGIRAGDILVSVNRREIEDVLDYRFRMSSKLVLIKTLRNGHGRFTLILKDEDDFDIGLGFDSGLMDEKRSCRNKCIFCFIDQNPKGMRESCYFKDDDSRLSFLHGNYITLTNLSEHDIDKIIEMHISPMNVSVHTTNPELRCRMMNNRFAGDSLKYLRRFADAGIKICAQIVLCRGINDGKELDRTMNDLVSYFPALDSVSIVPAGLTKHREGLYPLEPFSPVECAAVIKQVTDFGDMCVKDYGERIFYVADEMYVKAGLPLPDEAFYGEFSQLEDGVGMLTSFRTEAMKALEDMCPEGGIPENDGTSRHVSIATGFAAYGMISDVCREAEKRHPGLKIDVIAVKNNFFGESVTVAGLLTATDIIAAAQGKDLGEALYFPRNALRADGDLFLDGMTPGELSGKLGVPAEFIENDGYEFMETLCRKD